MTQLDTAFVRAQFPAFAEPSLAGRAFFENAGGSYACGAVIDRLTRFYRARKVQPYAPYAASEAGGAEMDEARARLSAMLGVAPEALSFGPSTTQNAYVLAQAFAAWMAPGDAVVVTDQDHEANSGPWRRLAERGFEVREWRMRPDGRLDPADLEPLLEGARLVCFPHCSNVVGAVNDAAGIVARVHAAGALACVDGVSYAPHGLPDIGAIGADIYFLSAYKTYGPHQGIMAVDPALAAALPNQGHHFNGGDATKRFTPAGPDHAQVAACAGIADHVDALHAHHFSDDPGPRARAARVHDLMRAHETRLLGPLLARIAGDPRMRLIGPEAAEGRAPTVAVALEGPGEAAAATLAEAGIMAGGGDFYAGRTLGALGVDPALGVLRLSFVHYTAEEEVDRLIAALDRLG